MTRALPTATPYKPMHHYPIERERGDKALTIIRCMCGYDTDPRTTDEERKAEVRAHVRMEDGR